MSNVETPGNAKQWTQTLLQPHPLTSAMQMGITFCSICVAIAAILFGLRAFSEERNARLVEIGVRVLMVDPKKEPEISAATREWALDLIDKNAGGVKFSQAARAELRKNALRSLVEVTEVIEPDASIVRPQSK